LFGSSSGKNLVEGMSARPVQEEGEESEESEEYSEEDQYSEEDRGALADEEEDEVDQDEDLERLESQEEEEEEEEEEEWAQKDLKTASAMARFVHQTSSIWNWTKSWLLGPFFIGVALGTGISCGRSLFLFSVQRTASLLLGHPRRVSGAAA